MDNSEKDRIRLKACYDEAGRLLRYPSRKELRPAVLGKLAEAFQTGRDYTEKEVNTIIVNQLAFSDVELIRRELIEAGILARPPGRLQILEGACFFINRFCAPRKAGFVLR